MKAPTGGASIRLGLDAVSGRATARLSACVGEGGVVCNYGSMSGEDPVMARASLIGDGQSLVGFILGRALATRSLEQIRAIYADLGEQVRKGTLSRPRREGLPDRGDQDGLWPTRSRASAAARSWSRRTGGSERHEALFLFVATPIDAYNRRRTSVSGSARGGERMAKGKRMRKEKKKPKKK